jgi:hypothetical protein
MTKKKKGPARDRPVLGYLHSFIVAMAAFARTRSITVRHLTLFAHSMRAWRQRANLRIGTWPRLAASQAHAPHLGVVDPSMAGSLPSSNLRFGAFTIELDASCRLRRAHAGAKQSIIRFSEPSANFPTHVHLDHRELLHVPRVDLVEVGG